MTAGKPILSEMFVTVQPSKIAFLKFILEGYDGLAILSTLDNKCGQLVLRFFPALRDDLLAILSSLSFVEILDENL